MDYVSLKAQCLCKILLFTLLGFLVGFIQKRVYFDYRDNKDIEKHLGSYYAWIKNVLFGFFIFWELLVAQLIPLPMPKRIYFLSKHIKNHASNVQVVFCLFSMILIGKKEPRKETFPDFPPPPIIIAQKLLWVIFVYRALNMAQKRHGFL